MKGMLVTAHTIPLTEEEEALRSLGNVPRRYMLYPSQWGDDNPTIGVALENARDGEVVAVQVGGLAQVLCAD